MRTESCINSCGKGCRDRLPVGLVLEEVTAASAALVTSLTPKSVIDVLLLLGDSGDGRCTAEMEFLSLLGESGADSNRCRILVAGGGVTERSTSSSPW